MRRAARTDGNHAEVVKALRDAGIAVKSLASVGGGVPDLLCALREVTCLLEVKDGSKPPSERHLTKAEAEFFATWPGLAFVVYSPKEAVSVVVEAARPHRSIYSGVCDHGVCLTVCCPECARRANAVLNR